MRIFLYLLAIGFIVACSKQNDPGLSQTTVYVAGYTFNSNRKLVAQYWKNGAVSNLTNGASNAGTTGIAISNNDVYVSGWDASKSLTQQGVYWKNGNENSVDSNCLQTISVRTSGADLYILGISASGWSYWKNNSATALVDTTSIHPTGISILENDVYVSGYTEPPYLLSVHQASCWKNGTVIFRAASPSYALGVATHGSDVFLVGYIPGNDPNHNTALYWKNGIATKLSDGSTNAIAHAIAVSGNDVYVAGEENGIAKYWKNGSPINLTDGSNQSAALSIAIKGSDVFVCGYEGSKPRLWKNAIPQLLSGQDSDGVALDLAVK